MVETTATLYQKDQQRFHLLLNEPAVLGWQPQGNANSDLDADLTPTRLLWFEISPYRAIATMQGQGGTQLPSSLGTGDVWHQPVLVAGRGTPLSQSDALTQLHTTT